MYSIFTIRRAAFGAALLCVGLAAANPAVTTADDSVPTRVVVHYGDLDLAQPKAAEILYRRLASAARTACDEPPRGYLGQMLRYKKCYQSALSAAVAKVNASTLTALHRTKMQRAAAG
jgi:UrcA family protein